MSRKLVESAEFAQTEKGGWDQGVLQGGSFCRKKKKGSGEPSKWRQIAPPLCRPLKHSMIRKGYCHWQVTSYCAIAMANVAMNLGSDFNNWLGTWMGDGRTSWIKSWGRAVNHGACQHFCHRLLQLAIWLRGHGDCSGWCGSNSTCDYNICVAWESSMNQSSLPDWQLSFQRAPRSPILFEIIRPGPPLRVLCGFHLAHTLTKPGVPRARMLALLEALRARVWPATPTV